VVTHASALIIFVLASCNQRQFFHRIIFESRLKPLLLLNHQSVGAYIGRDQPSVVCLIRPPLEYDDNAERDNDAEPEQNRGARPQQQKTNKTKQNKTKQNKTKQNKTKQNNTKQNKTKQNKTKQN
jgi:hypothetical protein